MLGILFHLANGLKSLVEFIFLVGFFKQSNTYDFLMSKQKENLSNPHIIHTIIRIVLSIHRSWPWQSGNEFLGDAILVIKIKPKFQLSFFVKIVETGSGPWSPTRLNLLFLFLDLMQNTASKQVEQNKGLGSLQIIECKQNRKLMEHCQILQISYHF